MRPTRFTFFYLLSSCLLPSPVLADINEQFDATCRITAANTKDGKSGIVYGTGCAIRATESYVAVMTNAHVVGTQANAIVTCEFWSRGHQSGKLPGQVFVSDPSIDTAVVLVPTPAFSGTLPRPLRFATRPPQPGETVLSVGCAGGGWQTGWKGHVLGYGQNMMWFLPPPADGRSGSAITNEVGEIVALLRVRMGDDSCGGAVDLPTLKGHVYTAMRDRVDSFQPVKEVADVWVQCPGGCCPGGSCPYNSSPPSSEDGLFNPPLFPRLHPQQQSVAPPNPWPTLPPASPATDLSPVIGAINSLQETIRNQSPSYPPPTTQNPSPFPDPSTLALLQRHETDIGGIRGEVQQIRGDIQQTHESLVAINKAIAPLETIERKVEQLEFWKNPTNPQSLASEAHLNPSTTDPTAWIKHALLSIAVVVALLSVALVVHAIHANKAAIAAGKPSPLEKTFDDLKNQLAAAASNHPALAPLASGAASADGSLVHKLLDNQMAMNQSMVNMALQTPVPAATPPTKTAEAASNVVNVHAP